MNSIKSHRQSSIHLDLSNQREFVASFSVQHRQNASAAFTLKSMRGGGGATYVVRYEYDGPRVRRDGNVVTLGGYGGERGEKLSFSTFDVVKLGFLVPFPLEIISFFFSFLTRTENNQSTFRSCRG